MNGRIITLSFLLEFISMNLLLGQDDYVKNRIDKFFDHITNAEYKDAINFIYDDNSSNLR